MYCQFAARSRLPTLPGRNRAMIPVLLRFRNCNIIRTLSVSLRHKWVSLARRKPTKPIQQPSRLHFNKARPGWCSSLLGIQYQSRPGKRVSLLRQRPAARRLSLQRGSANSGCTVAHVTYHRMLNPILHFFKPLRACLPARGSFRDFCHQELS